MRVERSVEVRPVARWQKAAGPDVEHRIYFKPRYRIEYVDRVGNAAVVRVEHEFDILIHRPIHVETDIVELELVEGGAVVRHGGFETGSQSGAYRNRAQVDLRP